MSWRYLAYRMNGDGTETLLDPELPLTGVTFTHVLSGSGSMKATVSPVDLDLVVDGDLLLKEWSTVIYPEKDDQIRGAFIISQPPSIEGELLNIEAVSFQGYPYGQPHVGSWQTSNDVLDVVRQAWGHLQNQPGGNLAFEIDDTASGVDPGIPAEPAREQVKLDNTWVNRDEAPADKIVTEVTATLKKSIDKDDTSLTFDQDNRFDGIPLPFEVVIQGEHIKVGGRTATTLTNLTRGYGTKRNEHGEGAYVTRPGTPTRLKPAKGYIPKRLNWWETPDLGKEIDDALMLAGMDAIERHWWDGTVVKHRLEIGLIGTRRHELRFSLGENILTVPQLAGGDDEYATEVLVLGAGEGPTMKRGRAYRQAPGLRRVAVVSDKTLQSDKSAGKLATAELNYRTGELELSSLVVMDHPNAPLGSFQVGDEIAVDIATDWDSGGVRWVRIIAIEVTPESDSAATLSVIPA